MIFIFLIIIYLSSVSMVSGEDCIDIVKIGQKYFYQQKHKKALEEFLEAEKCYENMSLYNIGLDTLYLYLGDTYYYLRDYDSSLEAYQNLFGITMHNNGEEHWLTALTYNNMGLVYSKKKDYDKAEQYYQKALYIRQNLYDEIHYSIAESYNNLGVLYKNIGDRDLAFMYIESSLNIKIKLYGEEHSVVAIAYTNLGAMYQQEANYAQALEYYQKSLEIKLKLYDNKRHPVLAISYSNVGTMYTLLGMYDRAIENFNLCLNIRLQFWENENHPQIAETYSNLGECYKRKGDYDDALNYHKRALKIRVKLFGENHPITAASYENLAKTYYKLGEYEEALDYIDKALPLQQNDVGLARIYTILGNIYLALGNCEKAKEYHTQASELRLQIFNKEHPRNAESYKYLGEVYVKQHQYDYALELYLQALEIIETHYGTEHPDLIAYYSDLGELYYIIGDYSNSQKYYEKTYELRKRIFGEQHISIAKSYNELGLVYKALGEYGKAEEYYNKSLTIRTKLYDENNIGVAETYNNLGTLYRTLGNYDKALEYYEKSLKIKMKLLSQAKLESEKDSLIESLAVTYNNIGNIYILQKDYEKALKYQEKSLDIKLSLYGELHPSIAISYTNLGRLYLEQNDYDSAISYFQKSLELKLQLYNPTDVHITTSYKVLSMVYENLGDYNISLEYLDSGLNNLLQEPDLEKPYQWKVSLLQADQLLPLPTTIDILLQRGWLLEKQYKKENKLIILREAYYTFLLATKVMENFRGALEGSKTRTFVATRYSEIYAGAMRTLYKRNQYGEGNIANLFTFTEAAISRTFLERLSASKATTLGGIPEDLILREQELQTKIDYYQQLYEEESAKPKEKISYILITQYYEQLMQVRGELDLFIKELETKYPKYTALKYPKPISLKDVQDLLKEQEIILMYYLGDAESYLLVIGKNVFDVFQLPSYDYIAKRIEAFLIYLLYDPEKDLKIVNYWCEELYKLLITPAQNYILDKDLIIVPMKDLYFLPFEALIDEQGSYLMDSHNIFYVPSLSVYSLLTQTSTNASKSFLGFGDPIFNSNDERLKNPLKITTGDTSIIRLPGTREEILNIASYFGDNVDSSFINLDLDASEKHFYEFDLSQFKYIHFATHGFQQFGTIYQPGLVLSLVNNPKGTDGLLLMSEVFNLQLDCNLVTLSACKTGLGKQFGSEGVEGLSRAFLYAGSRNVITSLWEVDDEATQELLSEFYLIMLNEDVSVSKALRKAKQKLKEKYQSPYFWAAFLLFGSGK